MSQSSIFAFRPEGVSRIGSVGGEFVDGTGKEVDDSAGGVAVGLVPPDEPDGERSAPTDVTAATGTDDLPEPRPDRPEVGLVEYVRGRWAEVPVGCRVVGGVFVTLRVLLWLVVHRTYVLFDSAEYRPGEGVRPLPILSLIGNALRPWTVPLFYRLLPNDVLRTIGQTVVSIAAWLVLAAVVAGLVRNRRLHVVAFAVILCFGSTLLVVNWDFAILSESLAISVAALTLAAWLRFATGATRANGVAVVVSTTLLVFVRPHILPLVAVAAVLVAVQAWRGPERRLRAVVAAGLAGLVVWGLVAVQNIEVASSRRDEGVGSFTQNFSMVLDSRIKPYGDRLVWFRDHGMPDPSLVPPAPAEPETMAQGMRRFASHRALVDWVAADGQRALLLYSAQHPEQFPLDFGKELPGLLYPTHAETVYGVDVPTVLPAPLDFLFGPTRTDRDVPSLPPGSVLLVALVGVALVPRRRPVNGPAMRTLGVVTILSVGALYLGWVVSPMETFRHAIPFATVLPVVVVIAILLLVDALLPSPGTWRWPGRADSASAPDIDLRDGKTPAPARSGTDPGGQVGGRGAVPSSTTV